MDDAARMMRHLVAYVINFITSKATRIGSDTELLHLVMRLQFNGWAPPNVAVVL
jgi:hypothetical protein